MKVKELIEILQLYDPDIEVRMEDSVDGWYSTHKITKTVLVEDKSIYNTFYKKDSPPNNGWIKDPDWKHKDLDKYYKYITYVLLMN